MSGLLLSLEHIGCEPPGHYEQVAHDAGLEIQHVRLDLGEPIPRDAGQLGVIAMGGPMGATSDDEYPWLADERTFIAEQVVSGTPLWGVCLGAQLLAASLGEPIVTGPEPEVGMDEVSLTSDAATDPVFGGLPPTFPVFQWHQDTFGLPRGSHHLAGSKTYPNQAFCVGSAYGIQFHLEVTADLAAEWATVPSYRAGLEALYGPGGTDRVLGDLTDHLAGNLALARRLFEAWLATYVLQPRPAR